jgi:hypothetical protein
LMLKIASIDDSDNEAFNDPTDFSGWVNAVSLFILVLAEN